MSKYKKALEVAKWSFIGVILCFVGFAFFPEAQVFMWMLLLAMFMIPVALFTALLTYADEKIRGSKKVKEDTDSQASHESTEYKKCPYCAEDIKFEANVCKHCGKDFVAEDKQKKIQESNRRFFSGCCLTIIMIPILIIVIAGLIRYYSSQPPVEQGANTIRAYIIAEDEVKKRLKAPRDAKFCGYNASKVIEYEKNKYTVLSCVDSQNSYGAMIRSNFEVSLDYISPNNWNISHIQIK